MRGAVGRVRESAPIAFPAIVAALEDLLEGIGEIERYRGSLWDLDAANRV
jgi:hypothetical protein